MRPSSTPLAVCSRPPKTGGIEMFRCERAKGAIEGVRFGTCLQNNVSISSKYQQDFAHFLPNRYTEEEFFTVVKTTDFFEANKYPHTLYRRGGVWGASQYGRLGLGARKISNNLSANVSKIVHIFYQIDVLKRSFHCSPLLELNKFTWLHRGRQVSIFGDPLP